jgi:hypothetical protein
MLVASNWMKGEVNDRGRQTLFVFVDQRSQTADHSDWLIISLEGGHLL